MKRITIDFSKCKYFLEIHYLIRDKLGLPKWYGCNLDALWDSLTGGFFDYCEVHLKGMDKLPKELQIEMDKIINIFKRAETVEYGSVKLIL